MTSRHIPNLNSAGPMPLLKLWNSLRGRSSDNPTSDDGRTARRKPSADSKPAAPKGKPARRILGIGGGPHGALCKQIRPLRVETVLEVSVGDGSRALAVLNALAKHNPQVRYAAIDQFEMSDSPVTLKEFHRSLRAAQTRAQLFPDSISRGLVRIASTIGTIDLVLIAAEADQWQTPAILPLIDRITHQDSVVFYLAGESWQRYQLPKAQVRRAA